MRRGLTVFAFVASLLLCVAVCVLWVRSYRTPPNQVAGRDVFDIRKAEPKYWLISNPGNLTLCRQEGTNWDKDLTEYKLLGVRFGGLWGDDGSLLWNLSIPYWLLACVTALPLPLATRSWIRQHRRRAMARRGQCPACGYDLRGIVPGCCPECGATTPNAAPKRAPVDALH